MNLERPERTVEDTTNTLAEVLRVSRDLAYQHRDKLMDQGFSREDAETTAVFALWDTQSALIGKLWPNG